MGVIARASHQTVCQLWRHQNSVTHNKNSALKMYSKSSAKTRRLERKAAWWVAWVEQDGGESRSWYWAATSAWVLAQHRREIIAFSGGGTMNGGGWRAGGVGGGGHRARKTRCAIGSTRGARCVAVPPRALALRFQHLAFWRRWRSMRCKIAGARQARYRAARTRAPGAFGIGYMYERKKRAMPITLMKNYLKAGISGENISQRRLKTT